jgi:hypothetical protein
LMERLVRVENALFCLKVKSACFSSWDNSEIERLEGIRHELHERYARAYSPAPEPRQRQEMATST